MAARLRNSQPTADIRTARVVFYLTEEDRDALTIMSEKLGLTRSSLTTSIMERLLIGGFSPVVGAKLCYQIGKRYEERGHSAKAFYFGIRPLPPLPEEEIGKRETKALLSELNHELKKQSC